MDCAYESIYGLGVGLSMRGAMVVKSNQMISQWWRSNYRYFDWLIGLFFSIRDFNQFSSTFFDYSRSGCVSEVPKLPAYSVACSRSSMESLPPPVSWNSLTSRRPMGKRYLFKLFSFPCQRPKSEANDKQKKRRHGNFAGEYACHVRSISIRGSNRYRESAGRVGWATSRSSFRCQSSSSIRSTNPQRNFSPSNPPKK